MPTPFGFKALPAKPKAKKPAKKKVAGPYRSQSSKPSIRKKATKREHRKVPVAPPSSEVAPKARKVRRVRRSAREPIASFRASTRETGLLDVALDYIKETPGRVAGEFVREVKEGPDTPFPKGSAAEAAAQTLMLGSAPGGAAKVAQAASKASTAASAEKVVEKAVKALKAGPRQAGRRIKSAPARKVRRITTAPKRAVKTAKRAPELKTKAGRKAARKATTKAAKRHPVRTGYGAVAAFPGEGPEGVSERARAFAEGHVKALVEEPEKTLKTTARAIPGIVTGPAAILGSAGSSAIHGTTKPLEEEASKQFEGLKQIGGKLLSGDSETVQKAVEDEAGLSFVAPLPAVSRVRNTKAYKGARSKARGKVAVRRQKTRAQRKAELREFKTGVRAKQPRKVRHAVIDTATGEERILRRTGKRLEGRRQRIEVSRALARAKAEGEREGLLAAKPVVKALRRSKLTSGKVFRRDLKGHDVGDVVATVAAYGLSRKRDRAGDQLKDIEASIGKLNPDDLPAGVVNDLANINWLRNHPEAFKDRGFWEAVDAYKKQAREIETSGRKKVLAISDVYGHARPEERLEAGVKVGERTVQTNFYKDLATLQRKQAELSDLRRDAKANFELAKAARMQDRPRHARVGLEIQARAKKLERELKDYRAGFKQAQKDYQREAQATIRNKGYEQPAYVKDVKPREALESLPPFPAARPSRKQHMARGEQARRGVTMQRDFETLVNQSIAEPRMRKAMHRATTAVVERWAQTINGKRYLTSGEISRAINRGDLDPSEVAILHAQHFKQAVLDPYKSGGDFVAELRPSLAGEIRGRANEPGNKYVVLPKEVGREVVHQMEPPKGLDRWVGGANRLFSRVILGYSPSWAVAQLVAEGIPAALSIGTNPARLARVAKFIIREDRKLSRKDRAVIDGAVGESAGVTPHPRTQLKPDTNLNASHFFKLSERNPVGRALLKGASGEALGVFNRYTSGKYRKAVAAAKADRELNGFVTSLSELMRGQRSIAEAIKGRSLKAQMEYIARHPKEAAKLERYLDDVMGNWRALTRHEAKFAPLIVFYPFIRYSLRWTFWSFPKRHPVKAQILYFLSQQNAEELEKLVGGPLASPLEYTFPVYTGSKGEAVMPGGSRIAPGMNAITTAIGKGKIEGLASAFNPAVGIGFAAIGGIDPFTGEKAAHSPLEHGLLALNQLLSLPAPARLDTPLLEGESARDRILGLLGDEEQSEVSKAFEEMDPLRNLRSFAMPFLPQPGERFGDSQRLSKALDRSGFNPELGDDAITAALDAIKKGDTGPAKRLMKRREGSDKASDEISALIREYAGPQADLPKLTDAQYEWLGKITGKRVFPYKPSEPNPFGLPDTDTAALREQFGIKGSSASELREMFGIK